MEPLPITLADVKAARERTAGFIVRTPLVKSIGLSERLGTYVSLKLELFQRTGSFKPRGAFNQLLALGDDARDTGVVGFSGGNFAQGLSYAGTSLDMKTKVLMPESTPANYVSATRSYGAEVELHPTITDAVAATEEYGRAGWAVAHPFDHPAMVAGNGVLGLEIVEDAPDVTDVIVSIGGGGLIAGVATAVKGSAPGARIWGVETEGADAMSRAIAAGKVVEVQPTSIAKTLGAPWVSAATLAVTQRLVESVTVVSDAQAFAGMRWLFERAKVVAEPAAGCVVPAADALRASLGDHVVLVVCGGNVSLSDWCRWDTEFS